MKWIGHALLIFLISISLAAMTAWGALAIYYSNLPGNGLRTILAALFALFGVALLVWYLFSTKRTRPLHCFFGGVSPARRMVVYDPSLPGPRLGARIR